MYSKIIVCLALDHGIGPTAFNTARKLLDDGGEIIAVHVYEPPQSSVSAFLSEDDYKKAYQSIKERFDERLQGVTDVEPVILEGHSGRTIAEYADRVGADCVVIGSHKPGLSDYFLGSTAARVVRHAPCAVHVLR